MTNTFTNCSSAFNQFCSQCSSTACTACIPGYNLINGYCYSVIPGCLLAMGSQFCYSCQFPLQVNIENSAQCVPTTIQDQNALCQVSNCVSCLTPNFCSACSIGYSSAANGSCVKNQCPPTSNCQLCDTAGMLCKLCQPGYTQSSFLGPNCVSIPQNYSCTVSGCSVCQTSNSSAC